MEPEHDPLPNRVTRTRPGKHEQPKIFHNLCKKAPKPEEKQRSVAQPKNKRTERKKKFTFGHYG
jgi:hypothetical protein